MLCRICIIHIQSRKHVLGHEDYAAPARQHELDHTDQESNCLERSSHEVGVDDLSDL